MGQGHLELRNFQVCAGLGGEGDLSAARVDAANFSFWSLGYTCCTFSNVPNPPGTELVRMWTPRPREWCSQALSSSLGRALPV